MPTPDCNQIEPKSLRELLSVPPQDIGLVDIGRANLLCSEGLPRAEHVDVEEHVGRLDAWAGRIRQMTNKHLPGFPSIASQFENSEPKWRLVIVSKILSEEFQVGYHEARIDGEPEWTDSQDLLIHGITGPRRKGTCPSLPVLFVAIGRRLGYPLHLATAPGQCFSRWEGDDRRPAWNESLNIEFHGHIDFRDDEHYYEWPVHWPESMRQQHRHRDPSFTYLQSLPAREEFAHSLCQRAVCLEAAGKHVEAVNAYYACTKYDKRWGGYLNFARRTLRSRAETVMRSMGFEPEVIRHWAIGQKLQAVGFLPPETTLPAPPQLASSPGAVAAAFENFEISVGVATMPQPQAAQHQPTTSVLSNQTANLYGTPPTNLEDIFQSIIHKTCEGTPATPSLELLLPHPPEPKVNLHGRHRETE